MKESDSLVIPAEAGIQEAVISSKARNFQFPNSITIFDYHRILTKPGDFVLCPLSSDLRLLISDLRHLSFAPSAQLNRVPFQGVQPGCPQNA